MDDVSKRFSFQKVYPSQIVLVGFYLENNHTYKRIDRLVIGMACMPCFG
jgi:hypothetical protein